MSCGAIERRGLRAGVHDSRCVVPVRHREAGSAVSGEADRGIGCVVAGCYPETPCAECSGEAARERRAIVARLVEPVGRAVVAAERRLRSVSELVADLRGRVAENDHGIGPGKVLRLFEEVADRLEELSVEVERLGARLDRFEAAKEERRDVESR